MKIHLAWIRVTATAAVLAGVGVQPAAAQYAPYRPIQQQPAAAAAQPTAQTAPRVAAQQPYWQQAARQASTPAYQPAAAQYPQTSAAYVPSVTPQQTPAYAPQQYAPSTAYAPSPTYAPAYAPTAVQGRSYPAYVARQPNQAQTTPEPAVEEETMPAPVQEHSMNSQPVEAMNGQMPEGMTHGQVAPNGYAAGCNCNGNYPSGSYYTGDQACGDSYDLAGYFDNSCHDSQWFGGVYFLYMERDDPSPEKLTVRVDHSAVSDPYYPLAHTTVLSTGDAEHDFREGVEVRLGSTFTISDSCDTCNTGYHNGCNSCGSCSAPTVYAWEVAWWGLDDSPEDVTYRDLTIGDPVRIYGMKNFNGLLYDRDNDGTAEGSVNELYGYELPIPDPGAGPYPDGYVAVVAQRVRTNFRAQNLELNFIRFPVCDFACGGCDSGCNSCDPCGCEQSCAPTSAFAMYGSCGVRYFRADDDFMYASESVWYTGGTPEPYTSGWQGDEITETYYDIQVDNNLIGPQLGWTMNYCVGCKWNFFANSTFGVFNNHIEQVQRMWNGGDGRFYFDQNGEDYDIESDKDDISFLGELRLGGSYDITCNWRAVAAYRAVAITGIANSTDQIPSDFTNYEYAQIIHSDNSLIVHGVQVGAECRY